jgi:hypothetical protein
MIIASLSQTVALERVQDGDGEKAEADGYQDRIEHERSPFLIPVQIGAEGPPPVSDAAAPWTRSTANLPPPQVLGRYRGIGVES